VLAGGVIFLSRHGIEATNYRVFRGEPAELRHIRGIFRGVLVLHSRAIIQLGLLILISTPYWYGIETHDGQHGWVSRDQLEQLP